VSKRTIIFRTQGSYLISLFAIVLIDECCR